MSFDKCPQYFEKGYSFFRSRRGLKILRFSHIPQAEMLQAELKRDLKLIERLITVLGSDL
jgi:hypothetical protein